MPPLKTCYTELTHRVVRESREPLPLDEITRRVSAIEPITTKHPKWDDGQSHSGIWIARESKQELRARQAERAGRLDSTR